ncbi:MAG: tetratricopeptide repeat protein [Bacteroidales bacterium]|nr:tetratricopeptide repeat protein [Bacteroidales bacterium]
MNSEKYIKPTCHLSRVTCHASRATHHVLQLFLLLLFVPAYTFSQEIKPETIQLLPFQQDAPKPGNEEQLALQFYQNQDYENAAELFEKLYDLKPSLNNYQYLLYSLVEIKEYGKAERLIKKCQRAESDAPRYAVDLGYVSYRSGNPEKAKKLYEDALKKLGPNQQHIFELANAFITRGENEYAIRTYVRGRELMKNTYPFGFELAGVYERMGDFKNATEEYLNMLDVNKSYLNTVQDRIQMTLSFDVNNEKNEILRKTLLSRAQKNPDNTNYAELLWWYSIQQKDFDLALIQAKALDRRFMENGDKLISLANLAVANEKYDVAIECYQYIVSKGTGSSYYRLGRRELANTRYLKIISEPSPPKNQLDILEKEFNDELAYFGEDPENISVIRNLAHIKAFYLGKTNESIDLLNQAVEMVGVPPVEKAKCKIELGDILLFTDDVWEATLLYQQVYQDFKYDVIGQEAKFKNAKLSFYISEFEWAKAQADILKAATSKFISNDAIALSLLIGENYDLDSNTVGLGIYARADMLDYRNEEEKALMTLDSISLLFGYHPIMQHVLFKKAEIFRKQGRFSLADSLFLQLVRESPDDILADEALMQAALLNEKQLKNREKAMSLFQEILDKYPGSIFVPDARKKFRLLRGDAPL